jgi:hypothetical protein
VSNSASSTTSAAAKPGAGARRTQLRWKLYLH